MLNFSHHFQVKQLIFYTAWFLCFSIPLPYANGRIGILSALLFIFWLVEGNFKTRLTVLFSNRLFLSLLAILGFSVLSLLWTHDITTGLEALKPYKYFLLAIPPIVTSLSRTQAKQLIFAFILGMTLHAGLAYLKISFDLSGYAFDKIFSPYAIYSPFAAFASLYYLNKFFSNPVFNRKNIVFLIISLLLVLLIFMTRGRAGQVIYLAGLVTMIFFYHRNFITTLTFLLIGVSFVALLLFNIESTKQNYIIAKEEMIKALDNEEYVDSWGTRTGLLLLSMEVVKKHPLIGTGVGDGRDEFQRVIERGHTQGFYRLGYWDTPHNQYMTQLTKFGLIGFALILIYIILFYRLKIPDDEMKKLSILFITLFCVNAFADEILLMKPYNTYFAIFSAIFMNLASTHHKATEPAS